MSRMILLGDEAVALGAVHAGLTAAYAYPGTPSTEILEYLLDHAERAGGPRAAWCANEKTAYEAALGTCFAGRRALVAMKHVGLNVAADPFVNSALVETHGGLVLAVADDPGMHSSQNEQDSRWLADFARVPCLEPATQQEAYDMTREAFDLSERFAVPVMLRLVTRLSHSRTTVEVGEPRPENAPRKAPRRNAWILLPANARRQWSALLDRQREMLEWSARARWNRLALNPERRDLGVITTGIARNYFFENLRDLGWQPSHLHLGAYPVPSDLVRRLVDHVERVLVLEDGYPYVERLLRGLLGPAKPVLGRMSGEVPRTGELSPDVARSALGLAPRPATVMPEGLALPNRPPQLCQGCPHGHMYHALQEALAGLEHSVVTSDIGCYTLGALPPYSAIESCVCMGASIGMARGAAEAGLRPVVAVIGDSTFLHSGIPSLLDAVAANADMTLLILDNQATAMTGGQAPLVPSSRLEAMVLATGVDPAHCHVLDAHPRKVKENAAVLRRELEHRGLSVVIGVRECKMTAKRKSRIAEAVAS
uniref:Indolepyruvate oxidoreductase subunit IorA n=1 Tax=Eiseniibacteriota bacterium TaxID=2212470 RepID=A0A832HYU5_UNCEI